MKFQALLYLSLLIALTGCTGMVVKNDPPPNKEQATKQLEMNPFHVKGKNGQHTKHMLAWIELSKD